VLGATCWVLRAGCWYRVQVEKRRSAAILGRRGPRTGDFARAL